jgi:ABC-type transport system involved in multi-copper enzyme maturation permease subunit
MAAYTEAAHPAAISQMVKAELIKVRSRWVPYILLLTTIVILALLMFGAYAAWSTSDNEDFDAFRGFAWPYAFPAILSTIHSFGSVLLPILAAIVIGSEYAWGTVRQALIRGPTRFQYLTAKLITVMVLALIGMTIAFGFGLLFSTIASNMADRPLTLDVPQGSVSVGEIAMMAVRTIYVTLVYLLLAFALAEIWRSSMAGIAGIIVYSFGEAIAIGILTGIGGRAADFRDILIGHNVSALLDENRIGSFDVTTFFLRPIIISGGLPDVWQATLVLALYSLFFLAVAYWFFYRRDVRV